MCCVIIYTGSNSTFERYARHRHRSNQSPRKSPRAVDQCPDEKQVQAAASKAEEDSALAFLKNDGPPLKHAPKKLRDDEEVVLAAVTDDGESLQYASERLRDNEEVVLAAVNDVGSALQYASERLRDSEKVVLAAAMNREEASLRRSRGGGD